MDVIRCALELLGFSIPYDEDEDEHEDEDEGMALFFTHPEGGMVPLDPLMPGIYFGDPWFKNTVGGMLPRGLGGRARREAFEQWNRQLRTALMECRRRAGDNGDDSYDD